MEGTLTGGETTAVHRMGAGGQDWRQEDSYEVVAARCLQKETEEGNQMAKGQGRKDLSLHVLCTYGKSEAWNCTRSKYHFKE